jgi:inorganic pyrophosphatase
MASKYTDVMIETPRGSAQKYAYDPELKVFRLKRMLPTGMVFPYDFGFVPGTEAEDGDPVDVIVLSEFKSFPGCLLECRIVGAILANQSKRAHGNGHRKKGKTIRNDRLIGISVEGTQLRDVTSIDELPDDLLTELEQFFANYHRFDGTTFEPIGRVRAKKAMKLLDRHRTTG